MLTLLWAPAVVSLGAAVAVTANAAWAEAGSARRAAAAISVPIRRRGVRFMPLRSFPCGFLPSGPDAESEYMQASVIGAMVVPATPSRRRRGPPDPASGVPAAPRASG